MLLILLLGYTLLMIIVAFALIVQDILELSADAKAYANFATNADDNKFFSNLVEEELGKEHRDSSTPATSPAPEKDKALLLQLATVPFPMRSYVDDVNRRARINEVMWDLRSKTSAKK